MAKKQREVTVTFTKVRDLITDMRVTVDGHDVGGGHFGGEPEDNMECRDYSWVKMLVHELAKDLGATVEHKIEVEQ